MKSLFTIIMMLLLLSGGFHPATAIEGDSLRLERRPEGHFIIHRVDAGETLYSLSRRYAADLVKIVEVNKLEGYSIDVGQIVAIPYQKKETQAVTTSDRTTHTVQPKETLYAISHIYGVNIYDIKTWNNLESDNLEVGRVLIVSPDKKSTEPSGIVLSDTPLANVSEIKDDKTPDQGYGRTHIVKQGETLYAISKKYGISQEKLRELNQLEDNNLSIGQSVLLSKKPIDPAAGQTNEIRNDPENEKDEDEGLSDSDDAGVIKQREVVVDPAIDSTNIRKSSIPEKTDNPDSQFEKVFEEGIGMEIENSPKTRKYLCLHRSLPIGTIVQVKNLMNSQSIFVRVVGKLPDIGANNNVLIRLSSVAYKRLGAIDARFPVEISYIPE